MTESRLVKASVSITVCVSSLKPGVVRLNTLCIYNYADIYAISLQIAFANTTAHTHEHSTLNLFIHYDFATPSSKPI